MPASPHLVAHALPGPGLGCPDLGKAQRVEKPEWLRCVPAPCERPVSFAELAALRKDSKGCQSWGMNFCAVRWLGGLHEHPPGAPCVTFVELTQCTSLEVPVPNGSHKAKLSTVREEERVTKRRPWSWRAMLISLRDADWQVFCEHQGQIVQMGLVGEQKPHKLGRRAWDFFLLRDDCAYFRFHLGHDPHCLKLIGYGRTSLVHSMPSNRSGASDPKTAAALPPVEGAAHSFLRRPLFPPLLEEEDYWSQHYDAGVNVIWWAYSGPLGTWWLRPGDQSRTRCKPQETATQLADDFYEHDGIAELAIAATHAATIEDEQNASGSLLRLLLRHAVATMQL